LVQVQEAYGQEILPPSYKQELYLKITSFNQENPKPYEYIREFE